MLRNWTYNGYPLKSQEFELNGILDGFAQTIREKATYTRLRAVIAGIGLNTPVELGKNVIFRPIEKEELWDFDDQQYPIKPFRRLSTVDDRWSVLDINIQHRFGESASDEIDRMRLAFLGCITLVESGPFIMEDMIQETEYGIPTHDRAFRFDQIKIGNGKPMLEQEPISDFKRFWPIITKIISSKKHYLRLPLTRLIDGTCRNRPEDAVIDFSIGLEGLLTAGIRNELKYRLALRGSTILNWDRSGKKESFKLFQEFYDVRSRIVHGDYTDSNKLNQASDSGYQFLRQMIQWFLNRNDSSLISALSEVDNKITS